MRPALLVLLYALAVAWCLPALLTPLTAHGIRARLGLAAWLTAMVSVLASAVVALQFLVRATIAGWPGLAEAVCRSVAGAACAPTVYRSAIFELGLAAAAIVAAVAAATLAWRYGRHVRQAQRRTRAHGEAARITGRRLRDAHGAVVLDAAQPVAYCVPGRPATIVLTSGALAVLQPEQLAAVLAHERAHLTGRHHLLIGLTRGLAASIPAVPLFSRGPAEVARLAEMCADDAAARRSGRGTLIAALLAMGTGSAVPPRAATALGATALGATALGATALGATALGATPLSATGYAVPARVQRLLEPPRPARQARYGLALITVTLALALASGLVTALAGSLAARGVPIG
jgi:Zn-dependent protease with chaperone function